MQDQKMQQLNQSFRDSENHTPIGGDFLENNWAGIKSDKDFSAPQITGVELGTLQEIGRSITTVPPGFKVS